MPVSLMSNEIHPEEMDCNELERELDRTLFAPPELSERMKEILSLHETGEKHGVIAKKWNITKRKVDQLVIEAIKRRAASNP
jgi:DNA-binding NarL/FixJ family response regulator